MSVGFRPTPADNEIIQAHKRPEESTSDVLRRALRALDRQKWDEQARHDMERIAASGEDLSDEPDDWSEQDEGCTDGHSDPSHTGASSFSARPEVAPRGASNPLGSDWLESVRSIRAALGRDVVDVVSALRPFQGVSDAEVGARITTGTNWAFTISPMQVQELLPEKFQEQCDAFWRQESDEGQHQPRNHPSASWKHAHLHTLARRAGKR